MHRVVFFFIMLLGITTLTSCNKPNASAGSAKATKEAAAKGPLKLYIHITAPKVQPEAVELADEVSGNIKRDMQNLGYQVLEQNDGLSASDVSAIGSLFRVNDERGTFIFTVEIIYKDKNDLSSFKSWGGAEDIRRASNINASVADALDGK